VSDTQTNETRDDDLSAEMIELLGRLVKYGYLRWNGSKMDGAAHDLIMIGYAEGRRPARHRNWYIDITAEGRAFLLGRSIRNAIQGLMQP